MGANDGRRAETPLRRRRARSRADEHADADVGPGLRSVTAAPCGGASVLSYLGNQADEQGDRHAHPPLGPELIFLILQDNLIKFEI